MPITVKCGACGKTLRVKDEFVGRKGKCPGCGAVLRVPQLPSGAQETMPRTGPGVLRGILPWIAGGAIVGALLVAFLVVVISPRASRPTPSPAELTSEDAVGETGQAAEPSALREPHPESGQPGVVGREPIERPEAAPAGATAQGEAEGTTRPKDSMYWTLHGDVVSVWNTPWGNREVELPPLGEALEYTATLYVDPKRFGVSSAPQIKVTKHADLGITSVTVDGETVPPLTYDMVLRDVSRYIGKRVTWLAHWTGQQKFGRPGQREVLVQVFRVADDVPGGGLFVFEDADATWTQQATAAPRAALLVEGKIAGHYDMAFPPHLPISIRSVPRLTEVKVDAAAGSAQGTQGYQGDGQRVAPREQAPTLAAAVEYRGQWVVTQMGVNAEGGFGTVVFVRRPEQEPGEVFLFGFDVNDLPEQYERVSFRDMKGVRGVPAGTKIVTLEGSPLLVHMVKSPTPIMK